METRQKASTQPDLEGERPYGRRRGVFLDVSEKLGEFPLLSEEELRHLEFLDTVYRALCAVMYNYVPLSGHPGGSISSGRIVANLLYNTLDYDVSAPLREDADIISYAAGHKALGLYSLWALRNEIVRIAAPDLLPKKIDHQLRLEDLIGFRRNPVSNTPLFEKLHAKALDGHPTPATPFVRLSTGASGVGLAASLGLAFGAKDFFGKNAPRVHIIEGEGGLTPGRVAEALAAAGTACLANAILHVDWNQASIDSNRVCREDGSPGDYVQWTPAELAYLHDWNVVYVPDGMDFRQVAAAQKAALLLANGQPTAVVYRTTKGWRYGIEGRASHGAGHPLCSEAFYKALEPLLKDTKRVVARCQANSQRCAGGKNAPVIEECLLSSLMIVREVLEQNRNVAEFFASRLRGSQERLNAQQRKPRTDAPSVENIYQEARNSGRKIPPAFTLAPGTGTTLRAELGKVLNHYNKVSGGAIFVAAADLLGSTSVNVIAQGFPEGYFNAEKNPSARAMSIGGICEDAMSGIMSGLASFGKHIGAVSSYGAFMAPLGHISARLHAIGNQARQSITGEPYRPFILVCAHAGLKTGEDGPTHADPQALQLLQDNFPKGVMITLTPWDPQEVWPLMAAALAKRPSLIAPFVTRPTETVIDRAKMRLEPASASQQGLYLLRKARGKSKGTIVLQGSEVAYEFINGAIPLLDKNHIELDVYYVASSELFDSLPSARQKTLFPEARARDAMGITGFTKATMDRWILSEWGRQMSLHPFRHNGYLGSGRGEKVLEEAGLDGVNQFKAIRQWLKGKKK